MKVHIYTQPALFLIRWLLVLLVTIEGIVLTCTFGIIELEFSDWADEKMRKATNKLQRRAPLEYGLFEKRG
jgi:hypothetical protein